MACVLRGSHSFACTPSVHPLSEWTIPPFTVFIIVTPSVHPLSEWTIPAFTVLIIVTPSVHPLSEWTIPCLYCIYHHHQQQKQPFKHTQTVDHDSYKPVSCFLNKNIKNSDNCTSLPNTLALSVHPTKATTNTTTTTTTTATTTMSCYCLTVQISMVTSRTVISQIHGLQPMTVKGEWCHGHCLITREILVSLSLSAVVIHHTL